MLFVPVGDRRVNLHCFCWRNTKRIFLHPFLNISPYITCHRECNSGEDFSHKNMPPIITDDAACLGRGSMMVWGRSMSNAMHKEKKQEKKQQSISTIGFIKSSLVWCHGSVIDLLWRVLLPHVTLINYLSDWQTACSSDSRRGRGE